MNSEDAATTRLARRRVTRVGAILVAVVTALVLTPVAASAEPSGTPYNCTFQPHYEDRPPSGVSWCLNGPGYHRAVIVCDITPNVSEIVYGYWSTSGTNWWNYSWPYCSSSAYRLRGGYYELRPA